VRGFVGPRQRPAMHPGDRRIMPLRCRASRKLAEIRPPQFDKEAARVSVQSLL
jgi:hypothetical protein